MKRYCLYILLLLTIAACSTTEKIPDGEQLYVGIDKVTYNETPAKRVRIRRDSVGVITTISDAYHVVENALSGTADKALINKMKEDAKGGAEVADLQAEEKTQSLENEATKKAYETAKQEVEAVLAYPPNNALFGSSYRRSPLQFGLWFYNAFADSKTKFGKWMLKTFGKHPILISTVVPDMRVKVAHNTLQNYGFFRNNVGYEIVTQKNPKKAKIRYNVSVGPLSLLDSIEYLPYAQRQDSLLRTAEKERILKSGNAFSVVDLAAEQTRIGDLFRENGYFFWQDKYTTYLADTLQRQNRVWLRVGPLQGVPDIANKTWYMGHTYIAMRRTEDEKIDSTRTRRNFTYHFGGKHMPLRMGLWRRSVSHRTGEPYSASDQRSTLEKLGSIGLFSQMDVNYVPRDTSANCDTLDIYVTALLDKPFSSELEMNATLKSNQQIGPGLAYSINKRNAFRGGETLTFKIFGSYEWQLGSRRGGQRSLLNSFELGAQLALKWPRFYAPFIARRNLRFPAETKVTFDADWQRRAGFFTMVSAGLGLTYNWHRKSNILHELTPLSIDFNKTTHTSLSFDSIMTANPALAVSMRNQFVPALSYTLTYTSPSQNRNSLTLQLHAKEAGNILSAGYAAFGRKFAEKDKRMLGSPYAQFLKTTLEARYLIRLNKTLSLATRFFGGVVWSYGNSSYAPYNELFYVGGANSIRGFTVRSLGPGAYHVDNSKYAYIDQTGDIRLEANAELRAHLFGSLHGAVFLDAGNVWLLRNDPLRPNAQLTGKTLKNIAVGTGLGLRYDLEFIVLRLDLGIGLHAPYDTGKSGFFNLKRFKDALNLHFAIGYPF